MPNHIYSHLFGHPFSRISHAPRFGTHNKEETRQAREWALIERLKANVSDKAASDELIAPYYNLITRLADTRFYQILKKAGGPPPGTNTAELQENLYDGSIQGFYKAVETYQPGGASFKTWLMTKVNFALTDVARRPFRSLAERSKPKVSLDQENPVTGKSLGREISKSNDIVPALDSVEMIHTFLKGLSLRKKAILSLKYDLAFRQKPWTDKQLEAILYPDRDKKSAWVNPALLAEERDAMAKLDVSHEAWPPKAVVGFSERLQQHVADNPTLLSPRQKMLLTLKYSIPTGKWTHKEIAKAFGLSESAISIIATEALSLVSQRLQERQTTEKERPSRGVPAMPKPPQGVANSVELETTAEARSQELTQRLKQLEDYSIEAWFGIKLPNGKTPNPEPLPLAPQSKAYLTKLVSRLGDKTRDIITLRLGLAPGTIPMSMDAISQKLGHSRKSTPDLFILGWNRLKELDYIDRTLGLNNIPLDIKLPEEMVRIALTKQAFENPTSSYHQNLERLTPLQQAIITNRLGLLPNTQPMAWEAMAPLFNRTAETLSKCYRDAIRRLKEFEQLASQHDLSQVPATLNSAVSIEAFAQTYTDPQRRAELQTVLPLLPEREREVLTLRLGLAEGTQPLSFQQIGAKLNTTASNAVTLFKKANESLAFWKPLLESPGLHRIPSDLHQRYEALEAYLTMQQALDQLPDYQMERVLNAMSPLYRKIAMKRYALLSSRSFSKTELCQTFGLKPASLNQALFTIEQRFNTVLKAPDQLEAILNCKPYTDPRLIARLPLLKRLEAKGIPVDVLLKKLPPQHTLLWGHTYGLFGLKKLPQREIAKILNIPAKKLPTFRQESEKALYNLARKRWQNKPVHPEWIIIQEQSRKPYLNAALELKIGVASQDQMIKTVF